MNLSILYKKLTNRKHTFGYKFILSLFVGSFGIISFCSAAQVVGLIDSTEIPSTPVNTSSYTMVADIGLDGTIPRTVCINIHTNYTINVCLESNPSSSCGRPQLFWADWVGNYYCFVQGGTDRYFKVKSEGNDSVYGSYFFLSDLLDENLPEMSTIECQTKYSLIPISSIDSNYCINNNLCPIIEGSGNNRSSLFINNIQYPGTPTIKFTIPEEIEREQNTDEEETNIDVIGYGYDQDKMQQMVNTQYYKPTAEEMNGLMEKVADFLPLVAVALLITRIRRVLKKVF